MNKSTLTASLVLAMMICGPSTRVLAQKSSGNGSERALTFRDQVTHGTVPPGQFGGPVLNHPELNTRASQAAGRRGQRILSHAPPLRHGGTNSVGSSGLSKDAGMGLAASGIPKHRGRSQSHHRLHARPDESDRTPSLL